MSILHAQAVRLASAARECAPAMARATEGTKNAVLSAAAARLRRNARALLAANREDIKAAKKEGLSPALVDRLALTPARIGQMVQGLQQVAALPDPVGQVLDGWVRPNGLAIRRVRVPLGVVLIVFESRPNVTVDAASICIKSGNACILRGGREALHTNQA